MSESTPWSPAWREEVDLCILHYLWLEQQLREGMDNYYWATILSSISNKKLQAFKVFEWAIFTGGSVTPTELNGVNS